MKSKLNIISMVVGMIFIAISVYIGSVSNFENKDSVIFILLLPGVILTSIGFVFTPKIWKVTVNIIELITMFFSKP